MIQIQQANKNIEGKSILKDININIEKGSIFGLIGPNGAGKTTLIKCMTGIWKLDKGSINILGEEVFENNRVKEKIGYVADQNNYYESFKVKDMVKFYRMSYKSFNLDRFNELNSIFKIEEGKFIKSLSKGMKMRLSIMLNLSIMPEVLVLDEPTSGLDPIAKREVLNILVDEVSERKTTILISTHNLNELERICDSIGIINNGKMDYVGSIDDMKNKIRKLQVVFKDKEPNELERWDEVIDVSSIGRVHYIVTDQYTSDFISKLKGMGAELIEEVDLSLEDMFVYTTGGELNVK